MKYLAIITIILLNIGLVNNAFSQMPDSVQPSSIDHSKNYLSSPDSVSKNMTNSTTTVITSKINDTNKQVSNNLTVSNTTHQIPNWVKAIFGYYAQGNLSDDDLIKALQFLIQQGIIKV